MFMHVGAMSTSAVTIPAVYVQTGIPLQQILIMVTIATLASTILSLFLATPLMRKIGPKWCLLLGSILCVIHFLVYATISDNPWPLYIGGCLGGASVALGTTAAGGAMIGSWFIEKRARMLGIAFGITSIGAGLWQVAGGYLIASYGVNMMWIIMSAVILVVAVGTNLLFIKSPEKAGQKPLGWQKFEAEQAKAAASEERGEAAKASVGLDLKAARKTASMWLLFLAFILAVCAINTYRTNLPSFLTLEGWSTIDSSNISGIRAIVSAIFLLAVGFLVEKTGLKVILVIMMATAGVSLAVLGFTGVGIAMVMVSVVLSLFGAGIGGPFVGMVAGDAFGSKDFAAVQTFLMASTFIAGSIAPLISSAVLQFGGTLALVNIIMAVFAIASILLFLVGMNVSPYVKARRAGETTSANEN
jgi:MFS family permease